MTETPADPWNDRLVDHTAELALFLGGSGDSFTGKLLELAVKADPENRGRLKLAFPREITALDLWQSCSPTPTFAQMRDMMTGAESWIDQLARMPEAAWSSKHPDTA